MWPPTANQVQGFTVVQHQIYSIGLTFRNIDEFKKRLVKSGFCLLYTSDAADE